jgi:predicted cupin superfamily sugar epimerase
MLLTMDRAAHLIRELGLQPHPEGGHYRETFRSTTLIAAHGGQRAALTEIYFLLRRGECSRWHRVRSDESWHWHEGDTLELLTCAGDGAAINSQRLGAVAPGVRPQAVVPAGSWQAARPTGDYALVGCSVAPGFDFADFSLIAPETALGRHLARSAGAELVNLPP